MLKRAVLMCALLGALVASGDAQRQAPSNSVRVPQKAPLADGAEAVFAKSASKVVFLISRKSGEDYKLASGVILTADGYIATNYHALQGADAIEIRFFPDPTNSNDYQSFNAPKLLYADAERDIAVLKVNANSLPFLKPVADTGPVRVGQKIYAIGNPKGLSNTISEGIVSALRSVEGKNLIQHTAAISPGSSGGALVDASGTFVGMNSWQVSDGQNLNFAISAKHLVEALAAARNRTTALAFPPEAPESQQGTVVGESTTWRASQPAVAALRTVVISIKECPRTMIWENTDTKGPMSRFRVYFGPPTNVVWDVSSSNSVRAPYIGYVEFTVPRQGWVPPDVYDKWSERASEIYNDLLFRPIPNLKYRYEFDIGPEGLQLTRTLYRSADDADWNDSPALKRCPGESGCPLLCWDQAAQKGQTVSDKLKP